MDKLRGRILAFFDPSRSIPLFILGTAALTLVLQAAFMTLRMIPICSGEGQYPRSN